MSSSATKPSHETRLAPEPLTTCPKCTYALTGLPSAHRCPECGFEFDEYSWVWKAPKEKWNRARRRAITLHSIVVAIFSLAIFSNWLFPIGTGFGMYLRILSLWYVVTSVLFLHELIFRDRLPVIVANQYGVAAYGSKYFMRRRFTKPCIAWTDLTDRKKYKGKLTKGIWRRDENHIWDKMKLFIRNDVERSTFCTALLDAKAHYLNLEQANEK